ncbi:hypothetical protein O0I10_009688 [Lichtheimia ornata]|uniref:Uncharacterized protein n=1 Tax=Lichtheimia ornata TaxID=688661 RepID=A0AAD7XYH1_9FUNG|nr:uncharacterized protein O0I10_009688 [Lichtheimia ornata]KAJ8654637.1 hypothetical protein O0I10_009688 [Lichtheimia ornata]
MNMLLICLHLGSTTKTTKKLKATASGVKVDFTKGKILKVEGPKRKMDHLLEFMQQLVVTTTVVGRHLAHKTKSMKQVIGNSAQVAEQERILFSVTKTQGEWGVEERRGSRHRALF